MGRDTPTIFGDRPLRFVVKFVIAAVLGCLGVELAFAQPQNEPAPPRPPFPVRHELTCEMMDKAGIPPGHRGDGIYVDYLDKDRDGISCAPGTADVTTTRAAPASRQPGPTASCDGC